MACSDGALIAGIGEEAVQPRELTLDPMTSHGLPITILDVGGMNDDLERKTEGVGDPALPACSRVCIKRIIQSLCRMPS